MSLEDLIKILGACGAIILAILAWVRYRPKDKVEVMKLSAEAKKVDAEAQKVRGEAEVQASAAAKTMNEVAMNIINRLDDELALEKESNRTLRLEISDMLDQMRLMQKQLEERNRRSEALQKKLDAARAELQNLRKRYGS